MAEESTVALEKLRAENEAMEKQIMALTKGAAAETIDLTATKAPKGGIQVIKYGVTSTGDAAGNDYGSAWRPTQCSRRTVLGGFFTS